MNDSAPHQGASGDKSPRRPLPPGTMIDHYVIQSVLGSGGFGITYLAKHELLGRNYALKEYFPDEFSFREGTSVRSQSSSEPTYRWGLERFLSEARSLARFKHPSIVDVVSVFETNGTAYLVLGYEPGRDLGTWLKQLARPPTQDEVDRILIPLLSAVETIHQHNLLHRDIAPDNIVLRDDGTPVLIDFGSAREAIRERSKAISAIIKRGFSPPEQYTSRPELQGPWSDIYALAATLYRMVSGQLPADATDRMLDDNLVPLAELAGDGYRPGFVAAIEHGLRVLGKDRPQSIAEWRSELFGFEHAGETVGVTRLTRPLVVTPGGLTGRPPTQSLKSPRPDLSWLDQVETPKPEPDGSAAKSLAMMRLFKFGAIGTAIGALAGGLSSIIVVSIVSAKCSNDSCVGAYLPWCVLAGALLGMGFAVKLAMRSPAEPPMIDDFTPDRPA